LLKVYKNVGMPLIIVGPGFGYAISFPCEIGQFEHHAAEAKLGVNPLTHPILTPS